MFLNDLIADFIITVRPLFGSLNCCRFNISCTYYAAQELSNQRLTKACQNIAKRLLSCWLGINI